MPEGCLIHAWGPDSPEMAVLTTFAVESIEETLRRVVELGGRVHSYVCSTSWRKVPLPKQHQYENLVRPPSSRRSSWYIVEAEAPWSLPRFVERLS